MTQDTPTSPSQPPSGDRIQNRADILESNLFNTVSKQNNPVTLQFQIDRETSPDPVIVKALIQLLPRLGIKSPQILILIRRLIMQDIPQGKELKLEKQILSLAGKGPPETAHLGITLRVFATRKRLAVEIKGVEPKPPKDGAIEKAFFDYERYPGNVREDGTIDFKEINKYPIVKAGDNLFFITPEVQGRSGMQYTGSIIHVPQAHPLTIALNGGVDAVYSMTQEGKKRGYFIRAAQTGVVVLTKTEGELSGVEVRDSLDVHRLDYATGNIGTHFVCPISMKIDTICSDFRIRARGTVEVGELEGGHIETESSATVHSAHPGSSVKAEKEIAVHFARDSTVSSLNGHVSIIDEAVDSRIDARGIAFEKYKGILAGTTLDTEHLNLKSVYLCGANTIHFGRRLFREKEALIQARSTLKEEGLARKGQEAKFLEDLHDTIKALSKILKTNPLLRDNLRTFILATQAMEYPVLYREIEIIGKTMNTKEVDHIKKSLDVLKKMPEQEAADQARDSAMVKRIAQAEHDMSKMELSIEGLMRRASSLRIFTPEPAGKNPDQPDFFLENQEERDTAVRIQGSYNRSQGFTITRL